MDSRLTKSPITVLANKVATILDHEPFARVLYDIDRKYQEIVDREDLDDPFEDC